jgi:hypothetical protein
MGVDLENVDIATCNMDWIVGMNRHRLTEIGIGAQVAERIALNNPLGLKVMVTDKMICAKAGLPPNHSVGGTCDGDSGGPLIWTDTNNQALQIGIVTFSAWECDDPKLPNGFTRLAAPSINDWIKKVVPGLSP